MVVAAPYCGELQTFGEFLELAATIAEDMTWAGLDGKVQLATFHPKYQVSISILFVCNMCTPPQPPTPRLHSSCICFAFEAMHAWQRRPSLS